MTARILKNGTALLHDQNDHVQCVRADILTQGNTIVKIEKDITHEDAEIVDCTEKLISPGLIDTHHHLWQIQLKGRHANELLLRYMVTGNWQNSIFSDEDFYWGELGGCMEAIWAGTTTVVDHAHLNSTPDSSRIAMSAMVSSGIRGVFGYCPITRINKWNPIELNYNILEPWVMETFEELARDGPFGNGRVTLGLAWDLYFLGKEVVTDVFKKAKDLGVRTITSHFNESPMIAKSNLPAMLADCGLLDESILFSHANHCSPEDANLIREANAHISSTPSTELQMALGVPECWRDDLQSHASLGVDCHTNNLGSIISEMRLGLQAARGTSNAHFYAHGKAPKNIAKTVEEAFNLGTIQGARAVRMEDKIGSIKVGKLADLIIFDTSSPGMICADYDPLAAIVLHSSPSDIEAVMVDGIWRKKDGKLLPVEVESQARSITSLDKLDWADVAKALQESRGRLQQKIDGLDLDQAQKVLMDSWGIDPAKLVESI